MTKYNLEKVLGIIIIVLITLRLVSLFFFPVTDLTEARYAEIGRKMFETGNYITPFIADGIPFWAKPPLSFWATAGSFSIFGVNNFAAHFPHFLFMIGVVWVLYSFMRRRFDLLYARAAAVILLTFPVFFYLMGGVMTDPTLAFFTIIIFVSFYDAINDGPRPKLSGYVFFAALGLALLAKGPLIFVLAGLPIFIWVLIKNRWRDVFSKLPWISGTLLMLTISMPWYIMAERATPGFLNYFFVGEHFQRFVVPHWSGDLYGQGHGGFFGKFWVLYFISILPWAIYLICRAFSKQFRTTVRAMRLWHDDLFLYLLLSIIVPILFFTFSKNILITYTITMLAPSAAIFAMILMRTNITARPFRSFAMICAMFCISITCAQIIYPGWSKNFSDEYFISQFESARKSKDTHLIYYDKLTYSGEFYSNGTARAIDDLKNLPSGKKGEVFVILPKSKIAKLPKKWKVSQISENKRRALLRLDIE